MPDKKWPRKGWGGDWTSYDRWPGDRRHVPGWRRRRGALFLRFVAMFGFMAMFFLGGLALAAFLLARLFDGGGQTAILVWILGCGLALALPMLAGAMAIRAFRSIATPLAGVMAAADDVAEGDLSVRVPVSGPRDFRRLATSFNRMTEELARAEEQRRNLTADVAHELRTPLHIIQGNLEGMLDGVYEPGEATIEATLEETRLLARLVEDLQTLSLAETGQLELVKERVNVAELLADVRTSFSGQSEAAGVTLDVVLGETMEPYGAAVNSDGAPGGDPGEAMTVWADYGRLDQVLTNLMANALRYTPHGGKITLQAAAEKGGVSLWVRDTGDGIPPEDLPYIFDRFWRGDPARSHTGGSSGLGLAIAQQLVRAHGGRITAESQIGQGTIFRIDLPAGRASQSKGSLKTESSDQEIGASSLSDHKR